MLFPGLVLLNTVGAPDFGLNQVTNLDSDCDVVTVDLGVNDLQNNATLGQLGDSDPSTIYGGIESVCLALIDKFPDKPKALFTPIKYRAHNDELKPIVQAIKDVGEKYAIKVYDSFAESDLQPDIDAINTTFFYQEDGLHPNGDGQKILAEHKRKLFTHVGIDPNCAVTENKQE